jgi:ATP-dependent Clp protease, protease subunit
MRDRLIRLLAENRAPFTPIQQRIAAAGDETTVYLYDPIVGDRATAEWWGGVCPQDFVPAVRAIKGDFTLRVNCPGGDVFGAEAMAQALREHPGHVRAIVEGLAASAATSITCACDEVLITPSSQFMVHEAWTLALGNKRDMRAVADLLEQVDDGLVAEYVRRTGKTEAEVRAWIEAETWFSAQAAVDARFCDSVLDSKAAGTKAATSARAQAQPQAQARTWHLSAYERAPQPATPAAEPPAAAAPAPAPAAAAADTGPDHIRQRQRQRARLLTLQPIE